MAETTGHKQPQKNHSSVAKLPKLMDNDIGHPAHIQRWKEKLTRQSVHIHPTIRKVLEKNDYQPFDALLKPLPTVEADPKALYELAKDEYLSLIHI